MDTKLAVDIQSISNMARNGQHVSPAEIFQIYREQGILLYDSEQGEAPIVIEGDVVIYDSQSEEGKAFLNKYKPQD